MEVLKLNRELLKWTGFVDPNLSNPPKFVTVFYYVNLTFPLLLGAPCLAYFCAKLDDVAEATNALYFVGIVGMTIAKFMLYSRQRENIFEIIASFQQIVEERKFSGKFREGNPTITVSRQMLQVSPYDIIALLRRNRGSFRSII